VLEDGISSFLETRVELLLIFVITLEDDGPFFVRLDAVLFPCKLSEIRGFPHAVLLSIRFVARSIYCAFEVTFGSTLKKLLTKDK
jgi:hypothetical protein